MNATRDIRPMNNGTVSSQGEAEKNSERSLRQQKELKKQKRKILFLIIMLCYAGIFTDYLIAVLKNSTPHFPGTGLFFGDNGIFFLIGVIVSSLVIGFLFYRKFGLALAFFNCILAPVAVFFLFGVIVGETIEWIELRKFYRLSPEEQERILEHQLCLDYTYSSRGP
jgi:cell division protein FtsW (lipid II flippase)